MGINFCKFHFPFVIDGWVDGWKIIKAKLHKRRNLSNIFLAHHLWGYDINNGGEKLHILKVLRQ